MSPLARRATLGSWPTILEHLRGRTCIFGQRPLEPGTTLQIAAETILIGKFGQLRKTMLLLLCYECNFAFFINSLR